MKNKINLIGISGKSGSGKSLIGKIIQYLMYCKDEGRMSYSSYKLLTQPNSNWEIKMFAGKVKEILCLLTGCTIEDLEDEKFKASYMPEEWNIYSAIDKRDRVATKKFSILKEAEEYVQYTMNNSEYLIDIRIVNNRITYRIGLQLIGTDLFRNKFHENTWVNSLFADYIPTEGTMDIRKTKEEYPNWILSDVRFLNEIEAIKNRKGIVIRVNRYPETVMSSRPNELIKEITFDINNPFHLDLWKGECLRAHHSETKLDDYKDFDYTINNSGSVEELIEKVREILIKEKLL